MGLDFPSVPAGEEVNDHPRVTLQVPTKSYHRDSISSLGSNDNDPNVIICGKLKRACSIKTPSGMKRNSRFGSFFLEGLNADCDDENLCPELADHLAEADQDHVLYGSASDETDDPLEVACELETAAVGLPAGVPMWAVRSRSFKKRVIETD